MWSILIKSRVFFVLLIPFDIVSATFPFRNRNSDLSVRAGTGGGIGRNNNPRLPVSPEAYMSSVSWLLSLSIAFIFGWAAYWMSRKGKVRALNLRSWRKWESHHRWRVNKRTEFGSRVTSFRTSRTSGEERDWWRCKDDDLGQGSRFWEKERKWPKWRAREREKGKVPYTTKETTPPESVLLPSHGCCDCRVYLGRPLDGKVDTCWMWLFVVNCTRLSFSSSFELTSLPLFITNSARDYSLSRISGGTSSSLDRRWIHIGWVQKLFSISQTARLLRSSMLIKSSTLHRSAGQKRENG